MPPTLDIIIPCYNAAATLDEAAASALRQRRVRHIWLVDDASQDDTAAVIRRLAAQHPQIRPLAMPANGGAAMARNWGALHSGADFVAFLDADDVYEAQVLEAAYLALAQIPHLSLVRLKLTPWGFPPRYLEQPGFAQTWRRLEMTVGGNMVFRRSIFLACGGFPQDALFRKFGGEDAALGIALTRSSVVGTLFGARDAAVLHRYRQGIHAERLLDLELFGVKHPEINAAHRDQAEAVTAAICRRLAEVKTHSAFGQTGIMEVNVDYA